jgi:hypothetical protein
MHVFHVKEWRGDHWHDQGLFADFGIALSVVVKAMGGTSMSTATFSRLVKLLIEEVNRDGRLDWGDLCITKRVVDMSALFDSRSLAE